MEYVGGVSLKQILKERMRANGGVFDPLPVDQALAYVLEVLPAFGYLHDLGLLYCDFKPDNVIQVGDAVKLIDLGGVRRVDDEDSAIYGTVGYQAPEVAPVGPSVASDIYTIGRTLTVLMTEFRGYQTTYVARCRRSTRPRSSRPHDSLHRLLLKACAPDPADRFGSADELRVQLLGVLREVVAARTPGTALTSAASVLFEAPASPAGCSRPRPARPARRHHRPAARLAQQRQQRGPGRAARPPADRPGAEPGGAARPGPGRAGAAPPATSSPRPSTRCCATTRGSGARSG